MFRIHALCLVEASCFLSWCYGYTGSWQLTAGMMNKAWLLFGHALQSLPNLSLWLPNHSLWLQLLAVLSCLSGRGRLAPSFQNVPREHPSSLAPFVLGPTTFALTYVHSFKLFFFLHVAVSCFCLLCASGHYVYIETSTGSARGTFAILEGPHMLATLNNKCTMSFWYHMYGSTIEKLEVYTYSQQGGLNLVCGQRVNGVQERK